MLSRLQVVVVAVLGSGCIVGGGDGFVAGSMWIDNCKEGQPLARDGDFTLPVDFFAGEVLEDSSKSPAQRSNRLTVRLQVTSNNIEESDGLALQFIDVAAAARAFAAGAPVAITSRVSCSGAGCPPEEDVLRARLYLYTSCRDCRQPLVGSSRELAPGPQPAAGGPQCLQPTGKINPPCPTLDAAARAQLDKLCAGDFRAAENAPALRSALGAGACLYLCRFGEARSGQDAASLEGFAIRYGDIVAGLFSLTIADGRALEMRTCAAARGQLGGMFSFEVNRGQSAQSFP